MFDLFLRHRRQPAVSKDIDSLLTGVLQDAQDPDGIKFACANDLLAYLCGPLRDAMINSLPNQFPAVRSRIGKNDTIVIVAAAVGEQAPIDRCLYAVISDFLVWLVCRTWLFDDIYQYPPILAAASTGKVEVHLHLIKALYKIYCAFCSDDQPYERLLAAKTNFHALVARALRAALHARHYVCGAILVNFYLKKTNECLYKQHQIEGFMVIAGKPGVSRRSTWRSRWTSTKSASRLRSRPPVASGKLR
jgi:hypothetical protein